MRLMNRWAWTPTTTDATASRDLTPGRRRAGRIAGAAITALLASTLVPGAMAPASADVQPSAALEANGFPAFFDDGNVKLRLCDTVAAGCSVDLAVDGEAFYFGAAATNQDVNGVGGNLEFYEAALEGAYANDAVVPGDEIAFGRMRFRLNNLDVGESYTITHPYGVNTFTAVSGARSINETIDVGCEALPCDFNASGAGFLGDFTANTSTFLRQVGPLPANSLGDPLVAKAVTGAPSGTNAVIVTGPNAGGPGIDTFTVSLFTIEGQIFQGATPAGTPSMPNLTSDTGLVTTDNTTSATLPTFTGAVEGAVAGAEATVNLLVDGATIPAGSATTVNGAYTLTLTAPLRPGLHSVVAESATVTSSPLRFTVDNTARLGDYNKDGRPDLVARDSTGVLWLYPGNGGGGFLARKMMRPGTNWNVFTSIVSPGDVTGDGVGDVLGRNGVGDLFLYTGDGAGAFTGLRKIGAKWNVMTAITAAGDMTSDAGNDILARDTEGRLWLYPLAGDGVFQTRRLIGTGWNVMTAISGPGDFSGDNRADILARDNLGQLWLYRGTGAGAVSGARTRVGTGWQVMTALVTPGNWNGNGGNDVLARDNLGQLWLYRGTGAGAVSGARTRIGTGWNGFTIG